MFHQLGTVYGMRIIGFFFFLPAAKPLVLERPELLFWWWWGDRIELHIL